ncbi:MAG: DNA-deoxyinosine glycosylase [Epsilonproteobacteria bacterium]|nr:DNA-deoxyinosine glycosylase [Campylobacterota bacterium]
MKWNLKARLRLKTQRYILSKEILTHPFKPVVFNDSKILILGTFPSIKSFENNFYYSHPKNQFWDILSILYNDKKPTTTDEKLNFLKKHKIALWDAICQCQRKKGNSRDDNLNVIAPCDIESILIQHPSIQKVATTSRLAQKVINKHFKSSNLPQLKNIIYLPSPSPLYAKLKLQEKANEWKKLLQ